MKLEGKKRDDLFKKTNKPNQINFSIVVPLANQDWLKISGSMQKEELFSIQELRDVENEKIDLVDNFFLLNYTC